MINKHIIFSVVTIFFLLFSTIMFADSKRDLASSVPNKDYKCEDLDLISGSEKCFGLILASEDISSVDKKNMINSLLDEGWNPTKLLEIVINRYWKSDDDKNAISLTASEEGDYIILARKKGAKIEEVNIDPDIDLIRVNIENTNVENHEEVIPLAEKVCEETPCPPSSWWPAIFGAGGGAAAGAAVMGIIDRIRHGQQNQPEPQVGGRAAQPIMQRPKEQQGTLGQVGRASDIGQIPPQQRMQLEATRRVVAAVPLAPGESLMGTLVVMPPSEPQSLEMEGITEPLPPQLPEKQQEIPGQAGRLLDIGQVQTQERIQLEAAGTFVGSSAVPPAIGRQVVVEKEKNTTEQPRVDSSVAPQAALGTPPPAPKPPLQKTLHTRKRSSSIPVRVSTDLEQRRQQLLEDIAKKRYELTYVPSTARVKEEGRSLVEGTPVRDPTQGSTYIGGNGHYRTDSSSRGSGTIPYKNPTVADKYEPPATQEKPPQPPKEK